MDMSRVRGRPKLRASIMAMLMAMLVVALLPAGPVGAGERPDAPPTPDVVPPWAPGSPFEPGPFTFFVESGTVVIGIGDDDPFVIEFSECPDGEPANDECITFEGHVAAGGTFAVDPEGVSFPQALFTDPLPILVTTGVSETVTGSIHPKTGAASMAMPMEIDLDLFANGINDCRIVVDLDLTSGASGDLVGSPFDFQDDRMSLVDGEYAIPETTVLSDLGAAVCGLVDGTVGLPSDSGENTAVFNLLMAPGHLD